MSDSLPNGGKARSIGSVRLPLANFLAPWLRIATDREQSTSTPM
jgi:hypothetical protein